ncbi:hypothetical protein N9J59_03685 [Gammaproteobacteria bacterium]|nr:hypothetical protein [Gammaproteobacteria bacterium]
MKSSSFASNFFLTSAFLSSMLLQGTFYILFHLLAFLYFFIKLPRFYSIHFFVLFVISGITIFALSSLFFDYRANDIFRDFIYLCKPMISVLLGYQFALLNNSKRILVTSAFFAVFVYFVFYVSQIIISDADIASMTVQQWRVTTGAGEFLVPLLIILIHTKFIKLSNNLKMICLAVLYFQVVITFSRSAYLFLLIYHLTNYFLGHKLPIRLLKYSLLFVFVLVVTFVISVYNSEMNNGGLITKILNSSNELRPNFTVDPSEAGLAWRGFEAALFFNDLATYSYLEILIGKGLGYVIELPFIIKLGGKEYSDLWFVHNGYLYMFMKLGLVSIGIFIFCISKFYRSCKSYDWQYTIVRTLTLFVIMSTIVMAGPLESNDFAGILIVMGYFYAHKLQRSRIYEE